MSLIFLKEKIHYCQLTAPTSEKENIKKQTYSKNDLLQTGWEISELPKLYRDILSTSTRNYLSANRICTKILTLFSTLLP